jgi:hypothetical protein
MPDVREVFRAATERVGPERGALERQRRRQHRSAVRRRVSGFAIAAVVLTAAIVVAITVLGDRGSHGGPASSNSVHHGSGPSAFPQMTGTATEKKLCSDLRNGASNAILYKDVKRVNNDKATIPDHLGVAAATFITFETRPRALASGAFDSFKTYCGAGSDGGGGPSGGTHTTRTATEKKLCSDLQDGASRATLYRDAKRVNTAAVDSDNVAVDAITFFVNYDPGRPRNTTVEIARLKTDCGGRRREAPQR